LELLPEVEGNIVTFKTHVPTFKVKVTLIVEGTYSLEKSLKIHIHVQSVTVMHGSILK
jgi:hypothetical protein